MDVTPSQLVELAWLLIRAKEIDPTSTTNVAFNTGIKGKCMEIAKSDPVNEAYIRDNLSGVIDQLESVLREAKRKWESAVAREAGRKKETLFFQEQKIRDVANAASAAKRVMSQANIVPLVSNYWIEPLPTNKTRFVLAYLITSHAALLVAFLCLVGRYLK